MTFYFNLGARRTICVIFFFIYIYVISTEVQVVRFVPPIFYKNVDSPVWRDYLKGFCYLNTYWLRFYMSYELCGFSFINPSK